MKRFPSLPLIAALLLLAVSLCPAQDQKQLDDLRALFERDPARGFVEGARQFDRQRRGGSLEGMMAVLRVVGEYAAPGVRRAGASGDRPGRAGRQVEGTGGDLYAARAHPAAAAG